MKSSDLTIIIHSYNDELNIVECINSAKLLTDKIIVIDMYSADKTAELSKKNGAEVFLFPRSNYVEPAREFGISKSTTEWLFLLDTDERIDSKLSEDILKQIQDEKFSHYKLPRKNIFGKVRWLKHGGWWPDYQIRLINKKFFKSWPKEIHSTPSITGQMGYLTSPLVHYFHGDLESMVDKTIIFEDIESKLLFQANKRASNSTFFRKFLGELFRRLIKGLGFLDGEVGIIESIYQAFSKTITYIYLYEKRRSL